MSIKTECHLRPAQCRCDKTGELLDRYSIMLAVSGLTIEQAAAILPHINTQVDRLVEPLRPEDSAADRSPNGPLTTDH